MSAATALGSLLLAASACAESDPHAHGPFLVNHSGAALELRIEWLELPEACEAPLDALAEDLPRENADAAYVFRLEPTRTARLASPPGIEGSNVARCPTRDDRQGADGGRAGCTLLRIRGDELPAYLVRADAYWESESAQSRCQPHVPVYEDPGQGALVIAHGDDAERALVAHERVELLEL